MNQAKQILLKEVRKLRQKAGTRRRDADKFDEMANQLEAKANELK